MKDIPERREDGNWIRNIKFRFPLPILRDGKEVVRVDGISLDVGRILRTFKIKKNVEVTDNGKDNF